MLAWVFGWVDCEWLILTQLAVILIDVVVLFVWFWGCAYDVCCWLGVWVALLVFVILWCLVIDLQLF